jgi:hypothetical protein
MSIDDERVLYERLDRAFETITPAPAPVEGAVRRGQAIRRRRRAAAAAGLAAVVAAGVIAVPVLRYATRPATSASGNYTVTVQAPGSHAPAGEIAFGTVNGQQWRIVVNKPGTEGAARGQELIVASGSAFGPQGVSDSAPSLAVDNTEPVSLTGLRSGTTQVQYGAVRDDVSYVTVRLGNGTVLTLHPVTVYGTRVVAFAAPAGANIVDATAYSLRGEIGVAVPFNNPSGLASFGLWLKPGQHSATRVSGLIGSGRFDGGTWSATAYIGSWGTCVVASGGGTSAGSCLPTTAALGTNVMFWTGGTPEVVSASASASVTRIVVTEPGGATMQIRPVTVAGQKFFAFPMSPQQWVAYNRPVWKWTAYDSSGGVVTSSEVTPGS